MVKPKRILLRDSTQRELELNEQVQQIKEDKPHAI